MNEKSVSMKDLNELIEKLIRFIHTFSLSHIENRSDKQPSCRFSLIK